MAQIRETRLVDDITGEAADETVEFGLDGRTYEIDLSDSNAKELRSAMAGYIESGRRTGGRAKRARNVPAAQMSTQERAHRHQLIRAWARDNGVEMGDRGRIPAQVVAAYEADQAV